MAKSLNTMVFRIFWLTWQGDSASVRCVTAGHRVSLRAGDLYSSRPPPTPCKPRERVLVGHYTLVGGAAEIRASRRSPEDEGVKAAAPE